MATRTKPQPVPDPHNPGTVILDRWPAEKEKTRSFRAQVDSARAGIVDELAPEPAPESEEEGQTPDVDGPMAPAEDNDGQEATEA